MSSTRKPKPPDRGAPDHKPSRKVALNEVLRSLQDLVQNELNVESGSSQIPSSATPAAPSSPPPAMPGEKPPASEDAAQPEVTLEETVLPDLTNEPSSLDTRSAPISKPAAPSSSEKTRRHSPKGGIQQELPYLDSEPATATKPEQEMTVTDSVNPAAASVEPAESAPETGAIPDLGAMAFAPDAEPAVETALPESETASASSLEPDNLPALPASSEIVAADTQATVENIHEPAEFLVDDGENLHDIPVLDDAVDLSETMSDDAVSAMTSSARRPAPTEARRLAIQAAARLNVALRKEGKPVLASDVIARLVRELEQVLANGAPNVDNTRPKQH